VRLKSRAERPRPIAEVAYPVTATAGMLGLFMRMDGEAQTASTVRALQHVLGLARTDVLYVHQSVCFGREEQTPFLLCFGEGQDPCRSALHIEITDTTLKWARTIDVAIPARFSWPATCSLERQARLVRLHADRVTSP
jgi:hypothetical protein